MNNAGFDTSGEFWTTASALLNSGIATVVNIASVAGLLTERGSDRPIRVQALADRLQRRPDRAGLKGTDASVHVVYLAFVPM